MSHLKAHGRNPARAAKPAATAVILLVLACLGLVACGGSSSSTSTSHNAAATSANAGGAPSGPAGAFAGRFKAVRECLQKNGITLPQRTPGSRRPPGVGGFLGGAGGPALPKGVTRAQYEAAVKKCGGGAFGRGADRLKSPAYRQALATFATCMRENGVNVPQPNTTGNGPVFSTKGLNTSSAQFKAAEAKCASDLRGAFRGRPGSGAPAGAPPGGAAPPAP
jgi:hypothetical protein